MNVPHGWNCLLMAKILSHRISCPLWAWNLVGFEFRTFAFRSLSCRSDSIKSTLLLIIKPKLWWCHLTWGATVIFTPGFYLGSYGREIIPYAAPGASFVKWFIGQGPFFKTWGMSGLLYVQLLQSISTTCTYADVDRYKSQSSRHSRH